jgi:hypothetical protein
MSSLPMATGAPVIPELPDGTVPLSRPFVARDGAPRISRVAPRIFTLQYFERCMECTSCADQCCSYGVGVGYDAVERIRSIAAELAPLASGTPAEWFQDERKPDRDYPEGGYIDTRVAGRGCALLLADGRGCSIHAWSIDRGIDYHVYKPLFCSLFPLTTDEDCLVPSIEVDERSLVCVGPGNSIYRGVRHELLFYFGEELVAELDALEKETLGSERPTPG